MPSKPYVSPPMQRPSAKSGGTRTTFVGARGDRGRAGYRSSSWLRDSIQMATLAERVEDRRAPAAVERNGGALSISLTEPDPARRDDAGRRRATAARGHRVRAPVAASPRVITVSTTCAGVIAWASPPVKACRRSRRCGAWVRRRETRSRVELGRARSHTGEPARPGSRTPRGRSCARYRIRAPSPRRSARPTPAATRRTLSRRSTGGPPRSRESAPGSPPASRESSPSSSSPCRPAGGPR